MWSTRSYIDTIFLSKCNEKTTNYSQVRIKIVDLTFYVITYRDLITYR